MVTFKGQAQEAPSKKIFILCEKKSAKYADKLELALSRITDRSHVLLVESDWSEQLEMDSEQVRNEGDLLIIIVTGPLQWPGIHQVAREFAQQNRLLILEFETHFPIPKLNDSPIFDFQDWKGDSNQSPYPSFQAALLDRVGKRVSSTFGMPIEHGAGLSSSGKGFSERVEFSPEQPDDSLLPELQIIYHSEDDRLAGGVIGGLGLPSYSNQFVIKSTPIPAGLSTSSVSELVNQNEKADCVLLLIGKRAEYEDLLRQTMASLSLGEGKLVIAVLEALLEETFADFGEPHDLKGWNGDTNSPHWVKMVKSIRDVIHEGRSEIKADTHIEGPDSDAVPTLNDQAVDTDALGRSPFASILAKRFRRVRYQQRDYPFRALIYAPWGGGKTSFLNFIKTELRKDLSKKAENYKEHNLDEWVIVDYNAWEHQRVTPPWWSLMDAVYRQSLSWRKPCRSAYLFVTEMFQRKLRDKFIYACMIMVLIIALLYWSPLQQLIHSVLKLLGKPLSDNSITSEFVERLDLLLGIIGTVGGSIYVLTNKLGTAESAKRLLIKAKDPMAFVEKHYRGLVKRIGRPVAVFIDDLDRCDSKFTVELLEGIQTVFRNTPVTYIVAADRRWVSQCFELEYSNFSKIVPPPGRKLGQLFLEKTFQLTTSLPRISPTVKDNYLRLLLNKNASGKSLIDDKRMAELQTSVLKENTREGFDALLSKTEDTNPEKQILRNLIAERHVDADMESKSENFLQRFSKLIDPNPRAMKRLINAYGIQRAIHELSGENIKPEKIALWTIMNLRWPEMCELIEQKPELIDEIASGTIAESNEIDANLYTLLTSAAVKAVRKGITPSETLTTKDLISILSLHETSRVS